MHVKRSPVVVALMLFLAFAVAQLPALAPLAAAQDLSPADDPGGETPRGAGTTYYVSNSGGNDNTTGLSPSAPWKTLSKVTKRVLVPGDTILFKRGDTWSTGTLSMKHSGSSGNPITYGAYGTTGARPKIHGGGSSLISSKSWIVVDRLHFHDGQTIRIASASNITFQHNEVSKRQQACVKLYNDSNQILVQFNKIHDCGGYSTGGCGLQCSGVNGEGIYIGSSPSNDPDDQTRFLTVRGNEVYNTTDDHIDIKENSYDIIAENNVLHTSVQNADMFGAITIARNVGSNITIRNNIIHSNASQAGIMTGGSPSVYNNLVYNNASRGIRVRMGGTLYHNTLYDNDNGALSAASGSTGIIKNNIGPNTANNLAASSELFLNAPGGDFRLRAGASAIDAGVDVGIHNDIVGTSRPQGARVDYGAYETVQGQPPAPQNLQ